MKILVTGNEGMIGSVVEKVLRANGYEVIGFDIVIQLLITNYSPHPPISLSPPLLVSPSPLAQMLQNTSQYMKML